MFKWIRKISKRKFIGQVLTALMIHLTWLRVKKNVKLFPGTHWTQCQQQTIKSSGENIRIEGQGSYWQFSSRWFEFNLSSVKGVLEILNYFNYLRFRKIPTEKKIPITRVKCMKLQPAADASSGRAGKTHQTAQRTSSWHSDEFWQVSGVKPFK